MKFILLIFCKKDLLQSEWVIVDSKMLCPQNSGSALKDFCYNFAQQRGAHEN